MVTNIYILIGLMLFWSVFLTVVFRLEKRMVWPYGDLESAPAFGDSLGYASGHVAEASAAGFKLLGWVRDVKGPTYRVNYAMLVSPERDIFAVIGAGTILKMPLTATWLHSPTVDGRSFYSTDQQTGVQIDLSHHWTNQLVPTRSFRELLAKHRNWLKINQVPPRLFTLDRELEEFRAAREDHYRCMEQAGLIAFTDLSGRYFRFTLLGAAKTATWSYFLGMARRLSQGRFPRNA
jgi:hypothetical protein